RCTTCSVRTRAWTSSRASAPHYAAPSTGTSVCWRPPWATRPPPEPTSSRPWRPPTPRVPSASPPGSGRRPRPCARRRPSASERLGELEGEAAQADAAGDAERSARIAVERDALVEQLSAAYGLGGRVRRAGSPAERARTAVTARIKASVDRIARGHPELGRHL